MARQGAFALIVVLLLFTPPFVPAGAAWPPNESAGTVDYSDPANWPNDPGYGGAWNLWSFVPSRLQAQVDAVSNRLGAGAHFDRAWAKTTGDPRVLIAFTDCGVQWSNADLLNQVFLNSG